MISREVIRAQLGNCFTDAWFPQWASLYSKGKVRDIYRLRSWRVLVTTDRQSAFDQVLGAIPLKGQVLNQLAWWWFERTGDIVPNHVIAVPDPNVMVCQELRILPVEVVVRAFLTGSTDTSAWMNYQSGRDPYDLRLPPGLAKNTRLDHAVITPTTKSSGHDQPLSAAQVAERGLVDLGTWEQVQFIALALFHRGTVLADKQDLILVDTKYEFGLDKEGSIILADEIHTPDSSRFWVAETYEDRHAHGQEPDALDKEFLRLWLKAHGATADHVPDLDDEIRVQVAERYIDLYERLTGQPFEPQVNDEPALARIQRIIAPYF